MKLNNIVFNNDPDNPYCIGDPCFFKLPDNETLIAGHSIHHKKSWQNRVAEAESHPETANAQFTTFYRSCDRGRSWKKSFQLRVKQCKLFFHNNTLFLLGVSRGSSRDPESGFGGIVLYYSKDYGLTWSDSIDIIKGGDKREHPNFHGASSPAIFHKGKVYLAFERFVDMPSFKASTFYSFFISCNLDSDISNPINWQISNEVLLDSERTTQTLSITQVRENDPIRWLEGTIVEAPNGEPSLMMRLCAPGITNKAALLQTKDGQLLFDYEKGFIDFPGGTNKFSIKKDLISGRYITLSNWVNTTIEYQRNILTLCSSPDLVNWTNHKVIITDDINDPKSPESYTHTAFSYAEWDFDGNDILFVCRTAYDGAEWFHDANRLTFHILENFRSHFGSVSA